MKVKVISLPYIFQVLYVLCFTRPRYQVSIYRTIGPLVFISAETAWPIKPEFYVQPPWVGGAKVYLQHVGHMTKIAAMPLNGKNPPKIFFWKQPTNFHETWYDLDLFYGNVKFGNLGNTIGKIENSVPGTKNID